MNDQVIILLNNLKSQVKATIIYFGFNSFCKTSVSMSFLTSHNLSSDTTVLLTSNCHKIS